MKEKDLCIAVGLSREMIKEIRDSYDKDLHWKKIESKKPEQLWEIEWTASGIELLKKNIGFKEPDVISKPEVKEGVVHTKYKNTRVLGVTIDGENQIVLCRDSNKFIINMPVSVRWDGARWCIVRHPRFYGKY